MCTRQPQVYFSKILLFCSLPVEGAVLLSVSHNNGINGQKIFYRLYVAWSTCTKVAPAKKSHITAASGLFVCYMTSWLLLSIQLILYRWFVVGDYLMTSGRLSWTCQGFLTFTALCGTWVARNGRLKGLWWITSNKALSYEAISCHHSVEPGVASPMLMSRYVFLNS